ncbi:tRNA lysidine(34) synthetase TilS [Desulfitobacterium metallireducens]|uniref:tRNA(Ile)-lysidine synthase n=1 Tax=Desulfitobacterium metallireducens DSM 15288 TaxID=871968 RepID=W0E4R9_9FIRM|nr:tRNA(Ile)-lysidine synthetase [Desulfitobacterium metallireducens DSM 15288]
MYEKMRQSVLPLLIPPHSRILVAVSGGPDSMALSHVLWRYVHEMSEQGISLVLTHVHHGLRQESDEEAVMVKEMAKRWEVPCVVHRFDAQAYAQATGQSFETAAREWRYARWNEDMIEYKCDLLATAHHLGDQAETVLYRLLRGSGTAGLAGIYPRKGKIIRPFLNFKKEDVLDYCQREHIPYAVDYTNFQPLFVRNRIRLELLPELKQSYNPKILEAIGRTAEVLRWDEEYLEQQTDKAWETYCLFCEFDQVQLSREVFQEPKAIFSRLVRRAAARVTGEPRGLGFTYVQQILESNGQIGWKQDLPQFRVHIRYEGILFLRKANREKINHEEWSAGEDGVECSETLITMGEWSKLRGFGVWAGIFPSEEFDDQAVINNNIIAWADFDREKLSRLQEDLVFRSRRSADTLWIQGIGHKSLKKVFQEAKINSEERGRIPLLASGSQILWIPGVKQSDSCRSGIQPKVRVIIQAQNLG